MNQCPACPIHMLARSQLVSFVPTPPPLSPPVFVSEVFLLLPFLFILSPGSIKLLRLLTLSIHLAPLDPLERVLDEPNMTSQCPFQFIHPSLMLLEIALVVGFEVHGGGTYGCEICQADDVGHDWIS